MVGFEKLIPFLKFNIWLFSTLCSFILSNPKPKEKKKEKKKKRRAKHRNLKSSPSFMYDLPRPSLLRKIFIKGEFIQFHFKVS